MPKLAGTLLTRKISLSHILPEWMLWHRALESAANLLNESPYQKMLSDRYASFDAGKGKEFEEGKLSLEELVAYAKANGEPKQTSTNRNCMKHSLISTHYKSVFHGLQALVACRP